MSRARAAILALAKLVLGLLIVRLVYFICEGIYWRSKFRRWKARGVPLLEHSLLWGHLATYKKLRIGYPRDSGSFRIVPLRVLENWRELFPNETECPPCMFLDTWPLASPSVFVWDPDQIHKFTVEKPAARDSKYFMSPVTRGHDLLSVDLATHREWRAKFATGFSQRKLIAQMPAILDEVNIFADKIKHLAGSDGTWGDVFQLEEPATSLTLDVIGRSVLGVRLGGQLDEENIFKTAMLKQIKYMTSPSLRDHLQRLNPIQQYRKWKNQKAMDSVILPQVMKRGNHSARPKMQGTLVEMVLEDHDNQARTNGPGRNSELVKGLVSNIKSFAFAGHDTTATTICWCFYVLGRYPSVLARMQAEHEEVFGSDPKQASDMLSQNPQKINDLPYTLAVIKETLRVYSIVFPFRKGNASLQLETSGGPISTDGFLVVITGAAVHLHPELWYKSKEFVPERWLVPKEDPFYPPAHAWRPFEHGPLNCIGQELALIELKLVLVRLVREVEILPAWEKWDRLRGNTEADKTTVDGQRAYPSNRGGGLLKPKAGMPVHVRLR